MSIDVPFTKADLEFYLKELAREFKKRGHGVPAEMILVGGASVLINYGFRNSTYDVDADFTASSVMKECINAVGDKYGLPTGWLNSDFKQTASYSPKIVQYSQYYKTFSNVLEIRTVHAAYLIAMKLVSGRKYKKDLSDIAGIILEQRKAGKPINYEQIDAAVRDLFGGWQDIADDTTAILNNILDCDDLENLFIELSENEAYAKETLLEIEKKYPNVVKESNVDEVIAAALKKKREKDKK